MRKARIFVVSIEIHCPHCKEPIAEPNSGSLVWETNSITSGQSVTCFGCGMSSVLPKLPS